MKQIPSQNKWFPISFFYHYMKSFLGVSALILLYITVVEVIVIFIYIDTRIKVLKIGDHEIKH